MHGIDTLDPDFHLTALHYAVKNNQYAAGRTVLHNSVAYRYNTKEVVLEQGIH